MALLSSFRYSSSLSCTNLMPGLRRFQCGVDAAKLDLLSMAQEDAEDGFRLPVVHFTCEQGKKTEQKELSFHLSLSPSFCLLIFLNISIALTIKERRSTSHLHVARTAMTNRTKSTESRRSTLVFFQTRLGEGGVVCLCIRVVIGSLLLHFSLPANQT